jgi:hypothetical protein
LASQGSSWLKGKQTSLNCPSSLTLSPFSPLISTHRELIISYFAYSAVSSVTSFHFFVDLVTDSSIKYKGEPSKLSAYEQATTAFIFINFVLSIAASIFAIKSMEEIKQKQREEISRFTVLSDTLQYEPDAP